MFTTGAIAFEDNYIAYAEMKCFGKYIEDVRPLPKMETQIIFCLAKHVAVFLRDRLYYPKTTSEKHRGLPI